VQLAFVGRRRKGCSLRSKVGSRFFEKGNTHVDRVIAGRIVSGATYRYHSLRMIVTPDGEEYSDMDGGDYRVLDLAHELETGRQMVCFIGLTGVDEGRLQVCTLNKFVTAFRLIEEGVGSVETTVPEKIAGAIDTGTGV
jgi:hypothetical protein